MRRCALALVVALAVSGAVAAAATAATPASCATQVVNDWYRDGRIDQAYPLACYRQALHKLPIEVQTYTDAGDTINRALRLAILGGARSPRPPGKPPVRSIDASAATSVPAPLIVLGPLALLLLAAGAAATVARKLQERRLPTGPPS